MPVSSIFDMLPLWAVLAGTALLVFGAVMLGIRGGRSRRTVEPAGTPDAPIGTVVGAVLGLCAFVLAFTFSIASARFDAKRQLLLEDVNAIGTAWLRTGLVPEPHRSEVRKLLREYVDLRVDFTRDASPAEFQALLDGSQRIQDARWSHAVAVGESGGDGEMESLFIQSLNDVIDTHGKRVTIWRTRIPALIWIVLFALTTLSAAAVGFQFGSSGRRGTESAAVLSLVFAVMISLIADLDRSAEGFLRVDQLSMIELQASLNR